MKKHFLDSGAFSWFNKVLKGHKGGSFNYSIYKTPEFWEYVDAYAEFIKKHKKKIDFYANVDACRNPKLSWKIQRYLEDEHDLSPIPVIHYNTHYRWLDKYLARGYDYIGFGGPLKRQGHLYSRWADGMFNILCNQSNRLPLAKTHGFLVTTHRFIIRYPWYSVDSVTWKKMSYYGQILVPPKQYGKFSFTQPNLVVFIDSKSPYTDRGTGRGRHFLSFSTKEQSNIKEWLEFIKVPFGERDSDGSIITPGVSNDNHHRCTATIRYYEHLRKSLPKWPWPFQITERKPLSELM